MSDPLAHRKKNGSTCADAVSTSENLSASDLIAFQECLDLKPEEFKSLLGLNIYRLRRGQIDEVSLEPVQRELMARYRQAYALALTLCWTRSLALDWLRMPSRALGGMPPLDAAKTAEGMQKLEGLVSSLRKLARPRAD